LGFEIIAYGIAISRKRNIIWIKDTRKEIHGREYTIPTVIDMGIVVII